MKTNAIACLFAILLAATMPCVTIASAEDEKPGDTPTEISLPAPSLTGEVSLEEALAARRSKRTFADEPISLGDVAQLLWAAQGVTGADWQRTAPSAGGLCPLSIYLLARDVDGLAPGVYEYVPELHMAARIIGGDLSVDLCAAALGQKHVGDAPAVILIAADFEKTAGKYGDRAETYVPLDAGHASMCVLLEATALGLGSCPTGAFDNEKVGNAMHISVTEEPLLLIPVGVPE